MGEAQNIELSNAAAGFTLGFGMWTCTTAMLRTRACARPLHSVFIWMVWGEILTNLGIGLLAWLVSNGYAKANVRWYILLTFFWIFEIQFYFQIIINRISIIACNPPLIRKLKWGAAILVTAINISVCIFWIPWEDEFPRAPHVLQRINHVWDRTYKGILCILDIGLNFYFLYLVRAQLINFHGLVKYKPLARMNACLVIVSMAMDVLLIGVETLSVKQGSVIFDSFHPITYLVKLHIELSLAALIAKLVMDDGNNDHDHSSCATCRPAPFVLQCYNPQSEPITFPKSSSKSSLRYEWRTV